MRNQLLDTIVDSIGCLEHLLTWSTSDSALSRHVTAFLGPRVIMNAAIGTTDALPETTTPPPLDMCVSYLLLDCPHRKVRRRIAEVIGAVSASDAEICAQDIPNLAVTVSADLLSVKVGIKTCVFKMLISKLLSNDTFMDIQTRASCKEYFDLLVQLIRKEKELTS